MSKAFYNFVTEPKDMLGYGVEYSWMWQDFDKLGDALVKAGVNMTRVEMFGCASTANHNESSHGLWCDHWPIVARHATFFLDAMKARKITTEVCIAGWNFQGGCPDPDNGGKPSTVCSKRFGVEWFATIMQFLAARGTEGLIIEAASEPYDARNRQCDARFDRFTKQLEYYWDGAKSWNKGSRPKTAPEGYLLEYHPLKAKDKCEPGCIVLTDTSLGKTFDKPNGQIDPEKLIPYAKAVHDRGQGFVYYGHDFMAWKDIDVEGLKAIGGIA